MKSLLLFLGHETSTATIEIMLAFSATTLWGRKINNRGLVVQGMISALREAGSALQDQSGVS